MWLLGIGELKVKVSNNSRWIVWSLVLLVTLHVVCIHELVEPVSFVLVTVIDVDDHF